MSRFPEPNDENDWSPVTARPGENFTVEGQIRGYGSFARGLKNDDPRLKPYRSSMFRVVAVFIGIGVVLVVVVALLDGSGS